MSTRERVQLLDRMLAPLAKELSPAVARRLIGLRANKRIQRRVSQLAEKCNEGTLTTDERLDYEAYVSAAGVVAVLQAQARHILANCDPHG